MALDHAADGLEDAEVVEVRGEIAAPQNQINGGAKIWSEIQMRAPRPAQPGKRQPEEADDKMLSDGPGRRGRGKVKRRARPGVGRRQA